MEGIAKSATYGQRVRSHPHPSMSRLELIAAIKAHSQELATDDEEAWFSNSPFAWRPDDWRNAFELLVSEIRVRQHCTRYLSARILVLDE